MENKKAIIVDLDGTIALLNRNPYHYHKCDTDSLNEVVANIVREEKKNGTTILFLSGRGLSSKSKTQDWLHKHDIPFDSLDMKPDNDRRNSVYYKRERVVEYMKEYDIQYALDDYKKVIAMFLSLSIPVIEIDEFTGEITNTHNIDMDPLF